MEQKSTLKNILRVKYSYGPYFWIGVCLLAVYFFFRVDKFLWEAVAVVGALLMLLDRILCRFRRLKIYEDAEDENHSLSENIELDLSIPPKFQLFDRRRGIALGVVIVGFYSSYFLWYYVLNVQDVFRFSGFYFWGFGVSVLLYQLESQDLYRWKKISDRSRGQELMLSSRAVYISARLIDFSGKVSSLEKKYVLTTSGHIMILWKDVDSWMLIRRPIFGLGPDFYCHEIKFLDGKKIRIGRDHLLDYENEILHAARRHTRVVVEETTKLWSKT